MPDKSGTIEKEFIEFTYIISHDLGAPLRTIVEFSRLLASEHGAALNTEGKEYLSLIIEGGEKLQAMMQGLLDYSRLNTTAYPVFDIDLDAVLKECRTLLEKDITASKATLEIPPLPVVKMAPQQAKQLWMALLSNALKFQPGGQSPRIAVSAYKDASEWVFSIRDNGIGIAPEYYERIFKPFQRLHTDDEYKGIGMGLTLAKKIIEHHGGQIWLESSPQQGTLFMFTLPDNLASVSPAFLSQ